MSLVCKPLSVYAFPGKNPLVSGTAWIKYVTNSLKKWVDLLRNIGSSIFHLSLDKVFCDWKHSARAVQVVAVILYYTQPANHTASACCFKVFLWLTYFNITAEWWHSNRPKPFRSNIKIYLLQIWIIFLKIWKILPFNIETMCFITFRTEIRDCNLGEMFDNAQLHSEKNEENC